MAYKPLFRKIHTDGKTASVIGEIQASYERFWVTLNKELGPNAEKTLAMRHLQESCMWLSRSAALSGKENEKPKESLVVNEVDTVE
ncbi:MAG: hypothetical protein P9L97_08920 [Candidatus Tenebribacter davisii]|nr:hypothetical protein [Candidatus Tenebribacter davisii]